ncbi:MAG: XdhC family protein [Candidatus Heimdallarchaeota archaeon]|nr:XdhC family protein [Candidatus Heimdallarchaeota archaeon]
MNEERFWKTILTALEQGKQAAIVVIINQTGSAPNVPGAKMFVTLDNIIGTVGGGISEHNLFDRARSLMTEGEFSVETVHMEHNNTAQENRSGMICDGSQTFALISLRKQDIVTIKKIIEAYAKARPGVLTINEKGICFDLGNTLTDDRIYSENGTSWTYQENIGIQDRLFCIGGGHVSLALSRIIETLGFHITVIDNRDKLPTMVTNTYAHEKKVISYDKIATTIPEGDNVYVVIMTYAHISDELVLEEIIAKKCRYIGMMASSTKKLTVFTNLEKKGISKDLLDSIHSPIGVSIRSHTPEEIAISIAAEIILVKNSNTISR